MSRPNRRELKKLKQPKSKLWLLNNSPINAPNRSGNKPQSHNKSNCKRTSSSKNDDTTHDQAVKVGLPSPLTPVDPKKNGRPPKHRPGLHFWKSPGKSLQHLDRLDCRGNTKSCSDESSNRILLIIYMNHII